MTGLSVLYAKEAAGEREWVATPDRDRTGRLREVTRRTDTEIVGRDSRRILTAVLRDGQHWMNEALRKELAPKGTLRAGIADTTSKRLEGVRPATASRLASAAGKR